MLDFPNSPTTGQIFQPVAGGPAWKFDSVKWLAQGAASSYIVAFDIPGVLTAGAVFAHVFGAAVSFPINFAGSQARGSANATGTPLITFAKSLAASPLTFADIGTCTIAAGTVTPTFVAASAPSFAIGDTIRGLVTTGDASFADLYLTLAGTR
jgi:hypothetical protein